MDDQNYVYLENVTVQGEVRMHGASNMVVRVATFKAPRGDRLRDRKRVPRNNYIVDNDVVGAAVWVDNQLSTTATTAARDPVHRSGHVVCFNHVKGFRDDISLMEYDEAYEQVQSHLHNDIEEATTTPWKPTRPWAMSAWYATGCATASTYELTARPGRPDLLHTERHVQRPL